MRDALAMIRDVLLIVVLLLMLWVGWQVASAASSVKRDLAPAVVGSSLPTDRCGGGVC